MSERIVTIATYPIAAEAHFFRDRLTAEGIRAFVADDYLVSTNWALGNAVGYIKLQVREADAEAARAVLERGREGEGWVILDEDEDGDGDCDAIACLECGRPMPADAVACPACGWSYSGDDESSTGSA